MNKDKKRLISTIICSAIIVLAHIAVSLALIFAWRYYYIYPEVFIYGTIAIISILTIVDIIFFVGYNHIDIALKIISATLAFFILIGGSVGTALIGKANKIVDNVLDNGSVKYETHSGVFVCYDKNNKFSKLEDLKGKKVGMLVETSNGIYYIAQNMLKEAGVEYTKVEYKTNAELILGLVDGDIDAMVITSAYREIYSLERDENSPFAEYLENFIDFSPFEKELKAQTSSVAKNITKEPFTVLLIGYSRTDIGSPIGLADSIILATINPQTYTVSMMSIARDSFVPIPCYGGEYDKINSPRSTSRQAFIETVENFVGMDIDYYMELDYLGLVEIVNAIGGIVISNPVSFELDGIEVPSGTYKADGQMVLQFCRERHHMPNGDFDRQQHQKECIIAIAKKFIESGDVSLALKAMEKASEFMSTDLTIGQLTTIFNLLLNTKNYTSLNTFDLVDFQTLRITGYGGIMYYSYSMRLPLWVYLIYKGSYDESMGHVYDALGKFEKIEQASKFSFSIREKYEAPPLYSLEYPNEFLYTPDPMPAFWATLSGMTLQEAMDWASANNVTLTVDYINDGDEGYNAELEGRVVGQSVRYGQLVSDFPSGTITIMGKGGKIMPKLPEDYTDWKLSDAIDYCKEHGYDYDTSSELTDDPDDDKYVYELVIKDDKIIIKYYSYGVEEVEKVMVPEIAEGSSIEDAKAKLEEKGFAHSVVQEYSDTVAVDKVISVAHSGEEVEKGSTITIYVSKGPKPETEGGGTEGGETEGGGTEGGGTEGGETEGGGTEGGGTEGGTEGGGTEGGTEGGGTEG